MLVKKEYPSFFSEQPNCISFSLFAIIISGRIISDSFNIIVLKAWEISFIEIFAGKYPIVLIMIESIISLLLSIITIPESLVTNPFVLLHVTEQYGIGSFFVLITRTVTAVCAESLTKEIKKVKATNNVFIFER